MKRFLVLGIVFLLVSCRTIVLESQNVTYNIPETEKYLYITYVPQSNIKPIVDKKISNIIAYNFRQHGWKIVKSKQNAHYILGWLKINTSDTNAIYIPQLGDTTISSINTYSSGDGSYIGNSIISGNSINSYGNINHHGYSHTDIIYNKGIVGYSPIIYTQYMQGFVFYLVNKYTKEIVYSFVLGVNDYEDINDNDVVAYISWALKNKFEGTNGDREYLSCDIDKKKRVKCN